MPKRQHMCQCPGRRVMKAFSIAHAARSRFKRSFENRACQIAFKFGRTPGVFEMVGAGFETRVKVPTFNCNMLYCTTPKMLSCAPIDTSCANDLGRNSITVILISGFKCWQYSSTTRYQSHPPLSQTHHFSIHPNHSSTKIPSAMVDYHDPVTEAQDFGTYPFLSASVHCRPGPSF